MTKEQADEHADMFALDFSLILEDLLLCWPTYSNRSGCPYPTVHDCKKDPEQP
jgi:hypothetical protein